ncbi:MAG: hypothetical protein C4516_04230 [Oxalobacter sp.]|jgi:hypothetical protein|nr:MAG: hypothetical protein C4516_04230 [Oxalobacter sp.]
MSQTNQCELLLARLKRGPITPLEALSELGIYRLGGRVYDLKQLGHTINSEIVAVGNGKRVARYTLVFTADEVGHGA